ncbi:hypothetical protein KKH82_06025 [Patescibacteria group bacterium]|nr:hypothetical protein [Patescibacteria group bacterium]
MERFVEFVDKVDSMNYQVASVDYKNNDKTLIGLHKKLLENGNTKYIYDYFKGENNTGFEILPEDYMKDTKVKDKKGENVPLKTVSEKKTTEIKKNMENFDDLKKRGYELNYKLTSFIVDIEEKLKD